MRYIAWTGGFDSTFLLCKRARESAEEIQPIYCKRPRKLNTELEMKAQEELLPLIRTKPEVIAKINDVISVSEEELPKPDGWDDAYERIKSTTKIDSYKFLTIMGRVAYLYPNLEMGIEAPSPYLNFPTGRMVNFFKDNNVSINEDGTFNLDNADADMKLLFEGKLVFLIYKINGEEELNTFKEWGWFEDIARGTRGCLSILPKPCGVCGTCRTRLKYRDAFKYLFDDKALKDFEIMQYLNKEHLDIMPYFVMFVINNGTLHAGNSIIDMTEYVLTDDNVSDLMKYFISLRIKFPNIEGITIPEI